MASDLMDFFIPFKRIMRFYESELSKELTGEEYSYGQWPYIFMIGRHEGSSIKDLCVTCGLDKGNSTRMISKLIESGHVENRSDRSRVYSLYLTETGWAAYERASKMLSDLCDKLFVNLTDEEKETMRSSLAKICLTLDEDYIY